MKINFVKSLCVGLVLLLISALVGCKNADDTNSSLPTSSVESTVTSGETVSDNEVEEDDNDNDLTETQREEFYDDYENCKVFSNGNCTDYNHKNVEEIVSKYFNLQNWLDYKPDDFLASLGIVKDFKYFIDDRIEVGNTTLHKTNIKYSDYKEKMLTYMSQKHFNETVFSSKEVFAEKDGYLYTVVRKYGNRYDDISSTVFFEKQENGKCVYLVYCSLYHEEKSNSNCWVRVSIIKENGIYVLDSCKIVDRKEAHFKGYDTLTDETAMAITYNRYNLLRKYSGSTENFLGALNIVDEVKFYDEKIVISEERELHKTNIKYRDFENQLLKYLSNKHLQSFFIGADTFTEKDGYLYIYREMGVSEKVDILEVKFANEKDGKYVYRAKCVDMSNEEDPYKFDAVVTIIKQNNVYVLDSLMY